jgi:hypothetical protein
VYCGLQVYKHLMALAKEKEIQLDPAKYTARVFYESLHLPPSAVPPMDPKNLPPVAKLHLTPDMEAAGMTFQQLRAFRHWHLAKWPIDSICKELALKTGVLRRSTIMFVPFVLNASGISRVD